MLAGRLAEALPQSSKVSILVIEVGPDSAGNPLVHMVGGLFQSLGGDLDWGLETVPQEHLNNRVLQLPRGKFLGGSSGFNSTLCIRGCKEDYDDWGLEGWTGEDMFRCMNKAETFHGKDWFKAAVDQHGTNGPLHTEPHENAPISNRILDSLQDKLPLVDDMFTTGEASHACGHATRTVHQGVRSVSTSFLRGYENRVDIAVNTVVDKIILNGTQTTPVATGVIAVDKSGVRRVLKARKEIIVSSGESINEYIHQKLAMMSLGIETNSSGLQLLTTSIGSYCSPTILLRSGIGPREELSKLNVNCLVDSPGVGKNFQDHLASRPSPLLIFNSDMFQVVFVPYEVTQPNITSDCHVHHAGGIEKAMATYMTDRSGFLASFPSGVFALARLDDSLATSSLWRERSAQTPGSDRDAAGLSRRQAHVEYMHTEMYSGHCHGQPISLEGKHGFEMMTLLFSQQSRGSVGLRSTDPFDKPLIDPRYLSDPLDMLMLTEGLRFAHSIIMGGSGTKDIVSPGVWMSGPEFAALGIETKREDWEPFVRQYSATAHHPAGTCRMGTKNDSMAVVDEKLRVKGVKGLRIADCSVMPSLNGGHTQMPAYAIGEKAAELIIEAWKEGTKLRPSL